MGYIRIIVDSKKCVANFDVGGGDEGSGGNSSSRGVNGSTTIYGFGWEQKTPVPKLFYGRNSTRILSSINTTPPTNIITMVLCLPPPMALIQ